MSTLKNETLPGTLQDSIIAALIYDEKWGAMISLQVKSSMFDGSYQTMVRRILAYREKYRRPPGIEHLDDLLGNMLTEGDDAPYIRKLVGGVVQMKGGLNAEYVAHRTYDWVRSGELKRAILDAGQRLQRDGEEVNDEVVELLASVAFKQRHQLDVGTRFGSEGSLGFLDKEADAGFKLGFGVLDKIGLRIRPKKLYTFVGAKNAGKSWFLVHVGRQALIHHKKVLHISLEMDADEVFQRYYQNWFVAGWGDAFPATKFEFDDDNELTDMNIRITRKALVNFRRSDARKILRQQMKPFGGRLGNLIVKEFPTGQLTIAQLRSYLDFLETTQSFVPDVLLVDYGDLMEIRGSEPRFALNRIWVDLRGLAVERNMAVVVPTQGNRAFMASEDGNANQVSEDISKTFTSDVVLVFQRTPAEALIRTARIFLQFSRNTIAGITVLITQNYSLGQFVCEAVAMHDKKSYKELLARMANDGDDETDDAKEA